MDLEKDIDAALKSSGGLFNIVIHAYIYTFCLFEAMLMSIPMVNPTLIVNHMHNAFPIGLI